ncbi:MAG: GGDEF domain-containing response regulator [Longimicrobiales bacterium]|nr:GGDEF domain-containing response regulator [Longimicrobiales bacterium]
MDSPAEHPLRILVVDDDLDCVARIRESLAGEPPGRDHQIHHVRELTEALERIAHGGIDLILLQLTLPDSEGIVTFERMHAFAPDVPILIYSREEDEETALLAVRGGAQDFLTTEELDNSSLRRAVRYALERNRLISALRSLSLIDDLTGLYNRRGFSDLGSQYLKLGRRAGRGAGLVFIDLDRFKTINDTLGHHVGDRALIRVADVLRATFRKSDLIARMGGDEFAVLAQDSWEAPEALAQRVRDAFAGFNATTREPYHLSMSVGATRTDGETRVRLEDLLEAADAAMYKEKRKKRKVYAS